MGICFCLDLLAATTVGVQEIRGTYGRGFCSYPQRERGEIVVLLFIFITMVEAPVSVCRAVPVLRVAHFCNISLHQTGVSKQGNSTLQNVMHKVMHVVKLKTMDLIQS